MVLIHSLILFAAALSGGPNAACSTLLARVDELQRPLALDDRIFALGELASAATVADPVRSGEWALEEFNLARQMSPSLSRSGIEKGALTQLAINDPDRAIKLYRQQDRPRNWAHLPGEDEDPRSIGVVIFGSVWERADHQRYLHKLVSLARFLGATGQYPYPIMARIANDIAPKDPRTARTIAADGVRYYTKDPGFVSTDWEYVDFVSRTWKLGTPAQLRKASEAGADSILRTHEDPGGRHWRIDIETELGKASFDSERKYLLFRLLPYLKETRSRRAAAVLGAFPELRSAPAIGPGTAVHKNAAVSRDRKIPSAERVERALNEGRLAKVLLAAEANDASTTTRIADEISDPVRKAAADAILARLLAPQDRIKAAALLAAAESKVDAAPNELQLRLVGYVAAGYYSLGDTAHGERSMRTAMDVAMGIIQAAKGIDLLVALDELHDTAGSAIRAGADPLRVADFAAPASDPRLRIQVLIAAAGSVCRA